MCFVKMAWLNSLRTKVLLAYVAGVVLSVGLIALIVSAIVSSYGYVLSEADVASSTKDMAGELEFNSEGMPVGFNTDYFDFGWMFQSVKQETAYRVLDASGVVVLYSEAGESFWPDIGAVRRLQRGRFEFQKEGITIRGATESVEHGGRIWYLQFAASTRFLELVYRAFTWPFTQAGIAVFSLLLLFTFSACVYVTLRYAFKPLRAISESAAAISPRSLHARLQTKSIPTEIAPLVDSFNKVLGRLEQGFRVQQEFLATAAHELKTPLALIRAQIELMDDGDNRGSLLNDVAHMTRQVQQLLLLAEASESQNYSLTAVDVQDVAKEAASYLQRMADAANVRLVIHAGSSGVRWQADRSALFTLFKNVLENAVQHAPPDSEVRVEISETQVSVRDWGPGVSQEQLSQIFSRFWRGAHRRDHGAGLGLTICREIAIAHGWNLSAYRADPGLRLQWSLSATEESRYS